MLVPLRSVVLHWRVGTLGPVARPAALGCRVDRALLQLSLRPGRRGRRRGGGIRRRPGRGSLLAGGRDLQHQVPAAPLLSRRRFVDGGEPHVNGVARLERERCKIEGRRTRPIGGAATRHLLQRGSGRPSVGPHAPDAQDDARQPVVVAGHHLQFHLAVRRHVRVRRRRENLRRRRRVGHHFDRQRRRHFGDRRIHPPSAPRPTAARRRREAAAEPAIVGRQANAVAALGQRDGAQRLGGVPLDRKLGPSRQAQRAVRWQGLRRFVQVQGIGRPHRDVPEKWAVHDADDDRVARRATVTRHQRQVGVERAEFRCRDALGEEHILLRPRVARRAPAERDVRPARRVHGDADGRTAQGTVRGIADFQARQQCAAPRLHGMRQRSPTVRATAGRERRQQRDRHQQCRGAEGAAPETAVERGREDVSDRGQLCAQAFRRPTDEHPAIIRQLHQPAHRAAPQLLLAFHGLGDRRRRRRPPHDLSAVPGGDHGEAERGEPDHERHDPRQFDPSRAAEEQRARAQHHDGHHGHTQRRTQLDEPGHSPALLRHQVEDRHDAGRLVTAYTKRFTPMRRACSWSSGGSLYVPTSSQPLPRSLSYE